VLATFAHVVRDHVSSTNQIPMLIAKRKTRRQVRESGERERESRGKGK
jgi:hypothetical protein